MRPPISVENRVVRTPSGAFLDRGLVVVPIVLALGLIATSMYATLASAALSVWGTEQYIVFGVQRYLMTGRLYSNPNEFPFIIIVYPPLYYWLVTRLCRAFAVAPENLSAIYLAARSLTTGATILLASSFGVALVRLFGASRRIAVLAASLAVIAIFPWGFIARPDALYLLLLVLGMLACWRYWQLGTLGWLAAMLTLLALAACAKQTALAFLPVLFLSAALRPTSLRRRAAHVVLGAAFLAAWAWGVPDELLQNSVAGMTMGISTYGAVNWAYRPFLSANFVLLAAFVTVATLAVIERQRDLLPIVIVTSYALIVGIVASLKLGAAANYFNEFALFALFTVATAASRLAARWRGHLLVPSVAGVAFVLAFMFDSVETKFRSVWQDASLSPKPAVELADFVRENLDLRATHLIAFDLDLLVFFPDKIAFASIDITGSSALAGGLDPRPVIAAIEDGRICYAVAERGLYDYAMKRSLDLIEAQPGWLPGTAELILPFFAPYRRSHEMALLRALACPLE
jgi:hypothetical protein